MGNAETRAAIHEILTARFAPVHLEVRDDSARHAGHPGARSGGGHFTVVLVTDAFEGHTRLERHRAVNAALGDLFDAAIHALALEALAPSEWATAPEAPAGPRRPSRT